MYQSINLWINQFSYAYIHIHQSINPSIQQSIHIYINPTIHQNIRPSIYKFIHPSRYRSVVSTSLAVQQNSMRLSTSTEKVPITKKQKLHTYIYVAYIGGHGTPHWALVSIFHSPASISGALVVQMLASVVFIASPPPCGWGLGRRSATRKASRLEYRPARGWNHSAHMLAR